VCISQGMTIKPLVSLLRIALSQEKVLSLYQEINEHVNFHLISLLVFFTSELFHCLWSYLWKDRNVYITIVIFLGIIIYDVYVCVNGMFSYQLLW